MGSTEAHGHPESLRGSETHVGAQFAGRSDQGEGQQVGADGDQRTALVCRLDERRAVDDAARRCRGLQEDAEEVSVGKSLGEVGGDDLDPQRFCAGGDHRCRLREDVAVDDKPGRLALAGPAQEGHGLGGRSRFVEHRRIGHLHAGQVRHHRLEVEQGFEAALTDLGLVRGVGGVPRRVLEDVADEDRRGEGVVVAEADHRRRDGVLGCECSEFGEHFVFGCRRRQCFQTVVLRAVENACRHHLPGQVVERVGADEREDSAELAVVRTDVAMSEGRAGHGGTSAAVTDGATTGCADRSRTPVLPLCPIHTARGTGGRLRDSAAGNAAFHHGRTADAATLQRRRRRHGPGCLRV